MATGLIVWCALGLGVVGAVARDTAGVGRARSPAEWGRGEAVLAGFLGFYFLLAIVGSGGESRPVTAEMVTGGMITYGVMLAFLLVFLAGRGLSPIRVFGLAPAQPGRVLGLGVGGFLVTYPVVEVLGAIAMWLGHSVSDGDGMVQYLRGPISDGEKAGVVVLAVVLAPLAEEFVFRGFLYGLLKKYFGALAAMGATALLFAAIHQNPAAIPAYFALAVGFTLIYERTGSLWAPIVMHAVFNALTVVVILFFPEWMPKA